MDSTSSSDIAIFTIQSKTKNQLHVEKGFMDEILCKKLTSLDKKRRSKRKRINKQDSRSSGETFETTVTNTSTTTTTTKKKRSEGDGWPNIQGFLKKLLQD